MSESFMISASALQSFVAEIFELTECSAAESARIAENLVEANLTGHDSHGVIRVPRYVEYLERGVQVANRDLVILVDDGPLVLVDGQYGMGQTVGPLAVELGCERADANGLAIVALRKAGHLGRIGAFAETAAERGLVSMHLVNVASSQLVAPFGSRDRRMGTNPLAFGVPRPDGPPVIHDFATSIVAEGKTGDPTVLYAFAEGQRPDPNSGPGALRAMGEHKGSGLSVMCELLAGALTGTGTSGPGDDIKFANGMLSIYLDPGRVDPDDTFAASVTEYIDWFLAAEPIEAGGAVKLPGDAERERRADREANGLNLPADLWQSIIDTAIHVGVPTPSIDAVQR